VPRSDKDFVVYFFYYFFWLGFGGGVLELWCKGTIGGWELQSPEWGICSVFFYEGLFDEFAEGAAAVGLEDL